MRWFQPPFFTFVRCLLRYLWFYLFLWAQLAHFDPWWWFTFIHEAFNIQQLPCFACSDSGVVILSARFSTEMLGSSVGFKVIISKPTIVSIQVDQLVMNIRLWRSLNKIQERLYQLAILLNQNRRGKS